MVVDARCDVRLAANSNDSFATYRNRRSNAARRIHRDDMPIPNHEVRPGALRSVELLSHHERAKDCESTYNASPMSHLHPRLRSRSQIDWPLPTARILTSRRKNEYSWMQVIGRRYSWVAFLGSTR